MLSDREIYEQIGNDLVRYATILVGPDNASDIVSTVIVRALSRGPLSELRNPRQYLMRAVSNEVKNVRRARFRADAAVTRAGIPDPVRGAGGGRFPDVTMSVMALPDRQRAAVFLVYWVGMGPAEAASVLGCRPATVRRYLFLAREKLRGFLDE